MRLLTLLSDYIASISEKIAGFLVFTVSVTLLIQVIARYIFRAGIPWIPEYARYATIWAVLLVANSLIKNDELISVDFFDRFWPKRIVKIRDSIYQVVFVFLMIFITIKGYEQAIYGFKTTTSALGISWFYPYLAIPVGASLMLYQYLYRIALNIYKIDPSFGKKDQAQL